MEVVDLIKTMIGCGHSQHLTRERSLRDFCEKYNQLKETVPEEALLDTIYQILKLLFKSMEWEPRYGGIKVAVEAINLFSLPHDTEIFIEFKNFLFEQVRILFVDPEFRVRNTIGEIMQKLIQIDGSKIYADFKEELFQNINDTFNRDPKGCEPSSYPGKYHPNLKIS